MIHVTDQLNAYKVFETLNARGVKLSATDLLKNYLFSVLASETSNDDALKSLDDKWESLVGRLGDESFPEFLRAHWLSRGRFVRQAELFKTIRRTIRTSKEVFELLRALDDDLDHFLALTHPESSHLTQTATRAINELRLFLVSQPIPLLMAARRVLAPPEFEELLRVRASCFRSGTT